MERERGRELSIKDYLEINSEVAFKKIKTSNNRVHHELVKIN